MVCKENATYPPYDKRIHYVMLSIQGLFIPMIVCSSILIIATVKYAKKLHNPQNQILKLIACVYILIGVVVIPKSLVEGSSTFRNVLMCKKHLWLFMKYTSSVIELTAASFMNLLLIDSFIQTIHPIYYKSSISIKWVNMSCIGLALFHIGVAAILFDRRYDHFQVKIRKGLVYDISGRVYNLYVVVTMSLWLIIAISFLIAMQVIKRKRAIKNANKLPSWLLLASVIFFVPSILLVVLAIKIEFDQSLVFMVARTIRLVVPWLHWLVVCMYRPIYKEHFKYFLKTNPVEWKNINERLDEPIDVPSNPNLQTPLYGICSRNASLQTGNFNVKYGDNIERSFSEITHKPTYDVLNHNPPINEDRQQRGMKLTVLSKMKPSSGRVVTGDLTHDQIVSGQSTSSDNSSKSSKKVKFTKPSNAVSDSDPPDRIKLPGENKKRKSNSTRSTNSTNSSDHVIEWLNSSVASRDSKDYKLEYA